MGSSKGSTAGGIWRGIWRGADIFRKIILNVVFFFFFFIVVIALTSGETKRVIHNNTALIINPKGMVVEASSSQPAQRFLDEAMGKEESETQLRDLITAINRAKDDDRINQLVLMPEHMLGIGMATLHELEAAIADFKTSGKPVLAYAESLSQHQYYLAAMADEVWLSPFGAVLIEGYASYRNFFKEALEKLSIKINLFRVGTYKSAMEPYIRNDMSPAAKESGMYWLNSLWRQYLEGIAASRGLEETEIEGMINNYPEILNLAEGSMAQAAIDMKLVDRLITRPEFRSEMISRGSKGSTADSYRNIQFKDYLNAAKPASTVASPIDAKIIAIIVAEGAIVSGKQSGRVIAAETVAKQIRKVANNKSLDALVLRVNSPGGSAFASEVIRRELQAVRDQGKPVVISMGDVAASGGYWISTSADQIWADPATITGSIGIFGMIPTFPESLARMGIYTDGFGTTDLAGLRLDRELDPKVAQIFQRSTERGYEEFLERVGNARQMSRDEVDEIAQGRVWSGEQAQERGLIDHMGGLQDAVIAATKLAGGTEDYVIKYQEPELTEFEQFMLQLTSKAMTLLPEDMFAASTLFQRPLIRSFLTQLEVLANSETGFATYAHCLSCSID